MSRLKLITPLLLFASCSLAGWWAFAPKGLCFVRSVGDTAWRSWVYVDSAGKAGYADSARGAAFLGGTAAAAYRLLAPRTVDTASTATPTPNCDSIDQYNLTALAANATFGAPTGTPVNGQKLIIRMIDNGTARTLAWNAIYASKNEYIVLPTTTFASKQWMGGFIYSTATSKWECHAYSQE